MSNLTHDAPPIVDPPLPPDLESRIKARRAELITVLTRLKTDNRLGVGEARDRLKARLSELAHLVKWGIADGWASVTEPVAQKLQHWLAESAHQVSRSAAATEASATTAMAAKAEPSR